MDYVLIRRSLVGRLKDVHVYRGAAAGLSDHFLVEMKLVVAKVWRGKRTNTKREVVRVEKLQEKEKELEYQEKLKEIYNVVEENVLGTVEAEWSLCRESLVE
ncbi:hypothetical protein, partial [Klebsiella pneumoniae]|uniref:hypothetical protein n=1 Tax=Klebsiella pneumoniae TaxID=573 RepID=UPI003EBD3672